MRDQSETGTHDKLAKLLDTIDVKLERYRKCRDTYGMVAILIRLQDTALLQLHHVRNLQPPTERDMDCLVKWFRGITGSDFLSGSERNMWPNRNNEKYTDLIRDEYVTIDPRASKRDYFSLFLEGKLLDLYHEVWRRMSSNNSGVCFTAAPCCKHNADQIQVGTEPLVEYKTSRFEAISTSIAVALSSLLPVLSILALYFVRKMILRIVLVLIFTTLFSVFLKVFTNARTAEIYSATAACVYSFCFTPRLIANYDRFAAVEVVFIGSDNINTA